MRTFESGATRDDSDTKLDFEGFLSPAVIERYAEYMHENRIQTDGNLRDSDNWQKGIPKDQYMKSLWRHFFTLWKLHRSDRTVGDTENKEMEDACCAIMFNVMGYLHEYLKEAR